MRKRRNRVEIHLDDAELAFLKKNVKLAGLATEQYLRNLIAGVEIRPRPPDELPELLHQLSAIGNNINQIAKATNARGFVRETEIAEIKGSLAALWQVVKNL